MPWQKKIKKRKKQVKLYLGITFLCFLIAAALHFIIEMGSELIGEAERVPETILDDKTIKKLKVPLGDKLESEVLQKTGRASKKTDTTDFKRLGKAYKGRINAEEIEKLKKAYEGKFDAGEMERLKKAYRERKVTETGGQSKRD